MDSKLDSPLPDEGDRARDLFEAYRQMLASLFLSTLILVIVMTGHYWSAIDFPKQRTLQEARIFRSSLSWQGPEH